MREDTFLRRTEGQLDEFIGRGMAVLDNLVEQKGFLKVFPCYSRRLYSRRGCGCSGCGGGCGGCGVSCCFFILDRWFGLFVIVCCIPSYLTLISRFRTLFAFTCYFLLSCLLLAACCLLLPFSRVRD